MAWYLIVLLQIICNKTIKYHEVDERMFAYVTGIILSLSKQSLFGMASNCTRHITLMHKLFYLNKLTHLQQMYSTVKMSFLANFIII